MAVKKRRAMVHERVALLGEVDYVSLAREFDVSEMTIRRDLEHLEQQGVVRRVTGGAIALPHKGDEPPFHARESDASVGKKKIAQGIVAMLASGQTVILDSGSTVLAVAREIRGKDLGLTVITPSVLAALELADEPATTVLLCGGALRPGELSLVGPEAAASFSGYNADVFVMGAAGVDAERGISDYHRGEAAVKKAAIACSDRTILAVDQSKFGRSALVTVADVRSADVIVCDCDEEAADVRAIERLGVDVHCLEATHVPGGSSSPPRLQSSEEAQA